MSMMPFEEREWHIKDLFGQDIHIYMKGKCSRLFFAPQKVVVWREILDELNIVFFVQFFFLNKEKYCLTIKFAIQTQRKGGRRCWV